MKICKENYFKYISDFKKTSQKKRKKKEKK
jgi:hypothetical protein